MDERIQADQLLGLCKHVFVALGVTECDAEIASAALVAADLRGVDSHGVAHLARYVRGLENGSLKSRPDTRVLQETPSTALLDGDLGLGFIVAHRAMELAIGKATAAGSGWVVVRRATHYGAAGYWAAMALQYGFIGVSMTNSTPRVAPTFGARGMLGTNPIALAVPADQEAPFVLDMATSVVPLGRLEVYAREGWPLPAGWVIDTSGQTVTDAQAARAGTTRREMAALPLGGAGEVGSGYKGYGLALGVEILTSLLAGYDDEMCVIPGREPEVGQLFGALSVEAFRPLIGFGAAMDRRLRALKDSPTLPGAERVLVAGQREFEAMQDRLQHGIPLHPHVVEELTEIGQRFGYPFGTH
jgi:L-2-hydroxycarboxylate dehydrogenase (NAD+)